VVVVVVARKIHSVSQTSNDAKCAQSKFLAESSR
jgi:hypothetical protein